MLLNPYAEPQRIIPYLGTRILTDRLNLHLPEVLLHEPGKQERPWCIQSFFAPIPGRSLGGIRARLIDEKGFITFCNQRDLEVLLDFRLIGTWCKWAGQYYIGPDDAEWFGLCADDDDLLDDLQERDLVLRANTQGGVLLPPLDLTRKIHMDMTHDYEELRVFTRDAYDMKTGLFPDTCLETIESRWVRSHRDRVRWDRY